MSTGSLLSVPVWRAVDSAGKPINGALAYFFETGTTTPADVYADAALSVPLDNPVQANSAGLFPSIYPDPAVTYRLRLTTSTGALVCPDVDPAVAPFTIPPDSVTAAMLTGSAVTDSLGFTPLNKAGDTATNLVLAFTGAQAAGQAGYLGLPPSPINAIYAFAMGDLGKRLRHTDATAYAWTIPLNASVAFPIGGVIGFRNFGSGIITLTRTAGVSLRLAGSTTDKDLAVAQWGYGAIEKEGTDVWVASGTGLS